MNESRKILLVEDNPGDARLIKIALNEARGSTRFDLTWTDELAKAFEALTAGNPAAVLLDLNLPDSQGLSTVISMVKKAPDVPIIVLTGVDDEVLAIQAMQNGAQDYLVKDQLDGNVLGRTIRYAIERKQAEDQLKYHARLLKHINDAVVATDDQFRITAWNRAAERMYGWSDAEVIGRNVSEILGNEFTDEQRAEARELLKESSVSRGERIYQRKDGRTIYVEANTIAFTDAQAKIAGYVSVDRDITERKQAEQEIESLANLARENTSPVLRFARDGRLLYANPASADLLRLWHCEIGDRPPENIQLIVYKSLVLAPGSEIEVAYAGRIDALRFVPIVDKDYVNVYGRDITERKQAETALRLENERFQRFVESNIVGIVIANAAGKIITANDYYLNILGVTRRNFEDGTVDWRKFTPPDWLAADEKAIRELQERGICEPYEKEYVRLDGTRIPVYIANAMLPGPEEQIAAFVLDNTERKQAEAALRESWTRIDAIIASAMDAIISINTDQHILLLNAAAEQMFQCRAAEVIGESLERFIPERFHAAHRRHIEQFGRDGTTNRTMGHLTALSGVRADGEEFPLEASISQAEIAGDKVFTVILRDITQRKRAEAQVNDLKVFNEKVINNSPIGILTYKLNGECVNVNENASSIIGASVEELKAQNFRTIDAWKKSGLYDLVEQAITSRTPVTADIHHISTFGKDLWLTAYAVVFKANNEDHVLLTISDITERKQAEEKIRQQVEHLNSLRVIDTAINSSFDLHVTLDIVLQQVLVRLGVDASAILLVNPHLQTVEYAASRGFHSNALRYIKLELGEGSAGRAALERKTIHISDFMETGRELAEAVHLAGEDFVEYYGTPLIVKGEVQGVLETYHRSPLHADPNWLDFLETLAGQAAIAIDNAQLFHNLQRSNAELEERVAQRTEELNQTNLELEHANHTKDEFLATMSHELRTPLNSILGLSETLLEQRRDPLTEFQQKYLRTIAASGNHLLELINDILDLSKIEAGKLDYYPRPLGVADLCRSSLAFVKEQATQKSITLTYQQDAAVSTISADPRRLKQVLVNLLTNAVKFTPNHGEVILQVSANQELERIRFSVIDNGIGIALADLKKLFQPFVQIDSRLTREHEGTGLGLALVQKLTDLHGGSVDVESKVGKGSRFTINLPWQKDFVEQQTTLEASGKTSTDQPMDESSKLPEKALERKLVLLAEDNQANILTIGDYLEAHGYQLVVAHDGLEAIAKAEELQPSLILMDIQMPALDGLEAIRRLRADPRFISTPIIALTALAMSGDRERCLEAGANEYMSKPVSLKALIKTMEAMLKF